MRLTTLMLEMIYGGVASWPKHSGTHMSGAAYLGAGGPVASLNWSH